MISCGNYIDCMLHAHALDKPMSNPTKNPSPLLDICLKTTSQECGPDERIIDAYKLGVAKGFGYCTLLGERMYVYVTC